MIRPPNRSVSAPTGIRPSEPTTTGTATSRACWNALRCSASLNFGASGLSRAHAQKLTANPTVAKVSIKAGRAPLVFGVLIVLSRIVPVSNDRAPAFPSPTGPNRVFGPDRGDGPARPARRNAPAVRYVHSGDAER